MDENLVTVVDFRQFIQETGHRTDAEKFGNAGVFDFDNKVWMLKEGVN